MHSIGDQAKLVADDRGEAFDGPSSISVTGRERVYSSPSNW
jgi:hypothetical protein